jgi:16S rRNA G966 N2-methylase RsmD
MNTTVHRITAIPNTNGKYTKVYTFESRMPRMILPQFGTHRVFCLEENTDIHFEMPSKTRKGFRRIYKKKIKELYDKFHNGARERKSPVAGLKIDVLEGLKQVETASQDLIIADPPYYKAINEKWDKQWKTEQEYLDCEGMLCYLNSSLRSKKADKIYKQFISIREKLDVACEFLNEPLAKDYYQKSLALKACGDIDSLNTEEKKINYLMAMHTQTLSLMKA